MTEKLIFEIAQCGPRRLRSGAERGRRALPPYRPRLRRAQPPALPEVSELQAVRHYTRLSQLNFSIDTHFYPLGSCTMKYNPRACNTLAMLPEFLSRHPLAPESHSPGLPRLHVRAAGNPEGRDRHGRRVADADGRRAGRVRRRGDDPRLSQGARRFGTHRDPRARCRARHQSGDRDHVRLHDARDPDQRRRRRRRRGAEGRGRPEDRRHHADQSVDARRVRAPHQGDRRASCTRPAACCITTAPTSTRSSARCGPATWASTSST